MSVFLRRRVLFTQRSGSLSKSSISSGSHSDFTEVHRHYVLYLFTRLTVYFTEWRTVPHSIRFIIVVAHKVMPHIFCSRSKRLEEK
jgi:hypothetical protein